MTPRRRGIAIATVLLLVVVVVVVILLRQSTTSDVVPRPDERALLRERVGFGASTSGGAGGRVVAVTSDDDEGPGTLREAVSGSSRKWVVFTRDMTIRLDSPLEVGSNTTVDGRDRDVTLTGHGTYGFVLDGVSNVIIESLTMRDFGDTARTEKNDKPDAINLDRASKVWIDHNDLSVAGDKLIAVSNGSTGVTVSWNHFHDQEQTFQVGEQATAPESAKQTVTVHHNFFDRLGFRMPVVSYGRAHVFDNYYLDWQLFAVRSERAAQVYLEDNVFEGGRSTRAVVSKPGGNGCNDARTRCDTRSGSVRATGNVVKDARRVRDVSPQRVFDPARLYRYDAEPAGASLARRVADGAGPR